MKIPELLCPAGNYESFLAAVNNGADAVYLGGRDFNARNSAANFSDDEIKKAINYAHMHGSKVNLTVNTLYRDSEIKHVLRFAEKMYRYGADAFILQDIGLFSIIKDWLPDICLHASTQMSIHSLAGVKFLAERGFHRVVLSRELSLDEIKEINLSSDCETEVFVHGALCVSYSGQCLMSSHIGGRSGNRGKCAQPCRKHYSIAEGGEEIKQGYLLSPRDIITLEYLKEICEAGVASLKIEGRMKSPEYVAVVTNAYRTQLDNVQNGVYETEPELIKKTTQIFNRGGSSTAGYFNNFAGSGMMSIETPKNTGIYLGKVVNYLKGKSADSKGKCTIGLEDYVNPGDGVEIWTKDGENAGGYINRQADPGEIIAIYTSGNINYGDKVYKSYDKKLADEGKRLAAEDKRRLFVKACVKAVSGESLKLTLSKGGVSVCAEGNIVQDALENPTGKERILKQLGKTGNTSISLKFDRADIGEGIFIPMGHLNELRRNAIESFETKYADSFLREVNSAPDLDIQPGAVYGHSKGIAAHVNNPAQLKEAFKAGAEMVIINQYALDADETYELLKSEPMHKDIIIALPKIMRTYDEHRLVSFIKDLERLDFAGYLVSTYGQLQTVKSVSGKNIICDYNFNVFNSFSHKYLAGMGLGITVSTEMTAKEMANVGNSAAIIYGNQELMFTHQCPVGLYVSGKTEGKYCSKRFNSEGYSLKDKTGAQFPVFTDCNNCYSIILNSSVLDMTEKLSAFDETNVNSLRLLFHTEEPEEVFSVVSKFVNALKGESFAYSEAGKNITYGHFFKGVE